MLLIPLELIKSNRDSVRKAREAYLIDRGQTLLIGEMRHEHFPVFHPPYSYYFLQLLIVIVSFRFLHCNVIYLAHAYILYFQISNCNVFVYVTLAFLRYPIVTVASGVRNTDLKCSALQVLHQDIESFNTNKPVLFHA